MFGLRTRRGTSDTDCSELQNFLRRNNNSRNNTNSNNNNNNNNTSDEGRSDDDDSKDTNRSSLTNHDDIVNNNNNSNNNNSNNMSISDEKRDGTTISKKKNDEPASSSSDTRNISKKQRQTVLPLSMRFMRCMPGLLYCTDCAIVDNSNGGGKYHQYDDGNEFGHKEQQQQKQLRQHDEDDADDATDIILANYEQIELKTAAATTAAGTISNASPMVIGPMLGVDNYTKQTQKQMIMERIMTEYIKACHFYGCGDRVNAGVLTTIRFAVPSLRVRGSFHDADMLALGEILIKYANGPLRYIRRLDFNIVSSKSSTADNCGRVPGFGSHGALTLSKILQSTNYIKEVFLERNKIGSYGATAIFIACSQNSSIKKIGMRGCMTGQRAALTFAEFLCPSTTCGLTYVDLSCNAIGYIGCSAIEIALQNRRDKLNLYDFDTIDLEGNLVLQEVMNSVTHGLGVIVAIVGASLLLKRVKGKSTRHIVSCYIYSASLVTLYLISTLYHSFFTLRKTKSIFQIMDKSAIYILIAGSYTPFLQIVLGHTAIWGVYLLTFLWACCIMGICVEFAYPFHPRTGTFSLAMYLAMGWSCVVCLPEVAKILPQSMIWMFLGGIAYTGGVPFFLRSNNLDHAIWHLFVLVGSILHWCGIYFHVAPLP